MSKETKTMSLEELQQENERVELELSIVQNKRQLAEELRRPEIPQSPRPRKVQVDGSKQAMRECDHKYFINRHIAKDFAFWANSAETYEDLVNFLEITGDRTKSFVGMSFLQTQPNLCNHVRMWIGRYAADLLEEMPYLVDTKWEVDADVCVEENPEEEPESTLETDNPEKEDVPPNRSSLLKEYEQAQNSAEFYKRPFKSAQNLMREAQEKFISNSCDSVCLMNLAARMVECREALERYKKEKDIADALRDDYIRITTGKGMYSYTELDAPLL